MLNVQALAPPPEQLAAFQNNRPSPWLEFPALLDEQDFESLRGTFPDRSLFELQKGIRRPGKQRFSVSWTIWTPTGVDSVAICATVLLVTIAEIVVVWVPRR